MVYAYLLIAFAAMIAAQYNFNIGSDINDACGVVMTIVAAASILLAIYKAGAADKRL
jgi:hypothetical protein